jgi:hypothetical protein
MAAKASNEPVLAETKGVAGMTRGVRDRAQMTRGGVRSAGGSRSMVQPVQP